MNKTVDILAFGVHPDDVDICASGTILKHIEKGYKVAICDMTRGELGTRGNPELRQQEAERSRVILGAAYRENLIMKDGFFASNEANIRTLVGVIRKYRPRIVLCNSIKDRHPDHGRASSLISEACFYSGLVKIRTSNLPPWRPVAVYHYIQDRFMKPDVVVDISPYMEKKIDAIRAFASQFYDPKSDAPETPISRSDFFDYIRAENKVFGRYIGVEYGEGFNVERPIGCEDMMSLF